MLIMLALRLLSKIISKAGPLPEKLMTSGGLSKLRFRLLIGWGFQAYLTWLTAARSVTRSNLAKVRCVYHD